MLCHFPQPIWRSAVGAGPGHPRYSPPRRTSPPRRFASPRPLPSRSASRRARTFSRARLPPPPPPPFAMAAHFQEDERVPDECENCGAVDGLALCSRCHSAHFCSRKCEGVLAVPPRVVPPQRLRRGGGRRSRSSRGSSASTASRPRSRTVRTRPPSPPVPPPASLSILGRFAFAAPSRVLEPDDERVPEPPTRPERTEPNRTSAALRSTSAPRRGRPARA